MCFTGSDSKQQWRCVLFVAGRSQTPTGLVLREVIEFLVLSNPSAPKPIPLQVRGRMKLSDGKNNSMILSMPLPVHVPSHGTRAYLRGVKRVRRTTRVRENLIGTKGSAITSFTWSRLC